MTNDITMTTAELLENMDAAREQVDAFLAELTPAQIAAPSTPTAWSIKDHIAHLGVWAEGMVALLNHQSRWGAMGLSPEFMATHPGYDQMNHEIYLRFENVAWPDVLAYFNDMHATLKSVIVAMTDSDLQRPYGEFDPNALPDRAQRPVVGWIIGNTYEHYEEHLQWMMEGLEG
ncbi:MAG: ClbS/DfsB family four-helix bundle protein [Anaerolineae bacterium]|nr:ClbS/DfsB family four-helix bundle protein [Anaerolineae bacterium]